MTNLKTLTTLAIGLAVSTAASQAALVIGGSSLLTQTYADQMESWLGQGSIQLENIFTKTTGDGKTSVDFHNAADGKGATFSVIELLETLGNTHQIIGGYNPRSWSRVGNYNYVNTDAERTAFLFNLSNTDLQRENFNDVYQTFNMIYYGPTFGGGHDLYVNGSLTSGYAFNFSYGGTSYDINIIGALFNGQDSLEYGTIEVFTVTPVPEPCTYFAGLSALGMLGLFGWRNRK